MNRLVILLAAGLLTSTIYAASPPPDARDIQGTWLPSSAELGGQAMTDNFLTNTVLKLDQGNYLVTVAGSPDKGTYTLDLNAQPKAMDINGTAGPNAGRNIPAIFELHGDTLRICYGLDGSPRPTEFKSPPGTKYFLVAYRRQAAK